MAKAEVAVIGGSGFERLFGKSTSCRVKTPYGSVSSISFQKIGHKKVVFLPRHGVAHSVPPHRINYRANVYALHMTGAERVIGTNAVGATNQQFERGDIVIPHDFIDFTKNRRTTFFDKAPVTHVDLTQPYCPEVRQSLVDAGSRAALRVRDKAVVACTEGPRLETPAEVAMLRHLGCDVVGMTTFPEVVLARELGMCYATLCYVSNLASGMQQNITATELLEISKQIMPSVKKLLIDAIEGLPARRSGNCLCTSALRNMRFE